MDICKETIITPDIYTAITSFYYILFGSGSFLTGNSSTYLINYFFITTGLMGILSFLNIRYNLH